MPFHRVKFHLHQQEPGLYNSLDPATNNSMENKPLNRSMIAAKASKQDEFYTQLSDIEKGAEATNRLGDLCKKTRNSPIRAIDVSRGFPDP